MRILIAPTAFKGSFSPAQVAQFMQEAIREYAIQTSQNVYIDVLPLADGGDGTIEAISLDKAAKIHELTVPGALNEKRRTAWLEIADTAVVELASACGIAGMAPAELRPLQAHTRGLGKVIRNVIETSSIPNIVVAVGGSASTDGGSGALYEIGARFFDNSGNEIVPAGGASLLAIERCDLLAARALIKDRNLMVATDVENPLLGKDGAAAVFGPQKGAGADDLITLETALARYSSLFENRELSNARGAGAAGGTAFGFASGLGARIISGFDWLAKLLSLEERLAKCDIVISGEGRIDKSSFSGKVIGSLFRLCQKHDKELRLVAGSVSDELKNHKLSLGGNLRVSVARKEANNLAGKEQIKEAVRELLKQEHEDDNS